MLLQLVIQQKLSKTVKMLVVTINMFSSCALT